MSRGLLDESTLELINEKLPEIDKLREKIYSLSLIFVSILLRKKPESTIPIASGCFYDAIDTISEARYALHEVYAHKIWYLDKKDTPDKFTAIYFMKFYSDDVALRLYSASEHFANAIIYMLEINCEEINEYKKQKKIISQASAIGNYLKDKKPNHYITKKIKKLSENNDWKKTICYRNKWVHEQPPIIEGTGIVYKRKNRWGKKQKDNGNLSYVMGVGGGDKPDNTIDELISFVENATFKLTQTLESVFDYYNDLIGNYK